MLFIALVIAAAAIPFVPTVVVEQQFLTAAGKLEALARLARHRAIILHQPSKIVFDNDGCVLERPDVSFDKEDNDEFDQVTYHMKNGISFEIKLWGDSSWHKPQNNDWIFYPTGLSDPVQIRLVHDHAFMELAFDPLTALVHAGSTYIP